MIHMLVDFKPFPTKNEIKDCGFWRCWMITEVPELTKKSISKVLIVEALLVCGYFLIGEQNFFPTPLEYRHIISLQL